MKVDGNDPAMPVPGVEFSAAQDDRLLIYPHGGVPLRLWIATHLWASALVDSSCDVGADWAMQQADRLIRAHNATCDDAPAAPAPEGE